LPRYRQKKANFNQLQPYSCIIYLNRLIILRQLAENRLRPTPFRSKYSSYPISQQINVMRTIALEEHFATPAYLDGPARRLKEQAERAGGRFAALIAQLVDVGDGRVAAVDAAGLPPRSLQSVP
jgi:hypothetical protein